MSIGENEKILVPQQMLKRFHEKFNMVLLDSVIIDQEHKRVKEEHDELQVRFF